MVQLKNEILLADSGSTKTDWRYISNNEIISFKTIGLNPNHTDDNTIFETLKKIDIKDFKGKTYFFGSGCARQESANKIKTQLLKRFSESNEIYVYSDLYGAALGLCGNNAGVIGILGTGASACLYNGKEICFQSPSLGYILGDDGSGTSIGKEILRAFYFNKFSDELKNRFSNKYNININDIINNVYNKPLPNSYIAQFARFAAENISNNEIEDIVINCFKNYFKNQILIIPEYKDYNVYFTGSIAYAFANQLNNVASEYNINIKKNIPGIIDELVSYFTEK
ncbi:MAG: ATPase [Marinilabiliales bacterium]